MDIDILRNFLVIAHEENLTHAADFLHISQPTLSRQIAQLEERFGKKLFDRGRKRMTLTQAGILFQKRARELVELFDKTDAELMADESSLSGDIIIASSESDLLATLFTKTSSFTAAHPGICYRLRNGSNTAVIEMVARGNADFGFAYEPIDLSRFEAIPLGPPARWGILAKKNALPKGKTRIKRSDMMKLPLIMQQEILEQGQLQPWLKKNETSLHIVGTFMMLMSALMMVEGGLGAALVTDNLIDFDRYKDLVFLPLEPRFEIQMNLIWKKYQVFSPAAEAFWREIQAYDFGF